MYSSPAPEFRQQKLLTFFAVQFFVALILCFIIKITTFTDIEIEEIPIDERQGGERNGFPRNADRYSAYNSNYNLDLEITQQGKNLTDACLGADGTFSCGLETCWKDGSINLRCQQLFEFEPIENSKQFRYIRRDVSHMHQQPRPSPSAQAIQADNFSLVLDFYCFGPGFNPYEAMVECFVRHLVLLVPLLSSPDPPPSVAVLPGYMLRYMEIVCKLLEARGHAVLFFVHSTHANQIKRDGLACLAARRAPRAPLALPPGYPRWFTYHPNQDPHLAATAPARARLARALAHRALALPCAPCSTVVVLCRHATRVIIDQVRPPSPPLHTHLPECKLASSVAAPQTASR